MSEVRRKLDFIRDLLKENNMAALRLRGVDWFSWIVGGGNNVVIFTTETGIAEVLITQDSAWILTNQIESDRLTQEEVPALFSVTHFPWQDANANDRFVLEQVGDKPVMSDRPREKERPLVDKLKIYKMKMQPEEIIRYRELGHLAAEAMTEAMSQANPDWTEHQLCAAGYQALGKRGIDPTLVLVAGEERMQKFRHPRPKMNRLRNKALMVFCARKYGLYANFTRFVFFRPPTEAEVKSFSILENIEDNVIQATRPGRTLAELYRFLHENYRRHEVEFEINRHHQGGPCGYLSRELIATPDSTFKTEAGMAFAWNPSLPGAKREETILVHEDRNEILTFDPHWPSREKNGILKPQLWIRQ